MSFTSKLRKQEGFTIVELLIVIAIIAILAAIAVPSYTKYQIRAHDSVLESDSESAYVSAQMYLIDNPAGTVDSLAKLRIGGYSVSPGITFSSGNMTILLGEVVIVSTTAEDSKNVATLHFNGNIDITAN